VHADELKTLAAAAESAERTGDLAGALVQWRSALELLPADSEQHAVITARTADLARRAEGTQRKPAGAAQPSHPLKRAWAAIATGAVLVLSKLKLLLLGLTKLSTLSSMLVFAALYWKLWGLPFALGFVACIYVHEMGHVASLARFGIAASPPMFIPGFGALVRLKQTPTDPRQDSRVGLAGPIWGLAAALVAYGVFLATGAPIWGGIAQFAGFLNLFNLIPVWQLDGSRGFRSLSREERWIIIAVVAATWLLTRQGLLILIGLAAIYRAVSDVAPRERDWPVLGTFAGLVVALSLLSALHVVPAR
jgi:Zn-dependent protease